MRPGNPQPTLDTLAQLCGVSKTTVSNAYNHPERLSAKLRDIILATAHDIGYPGPHPVARSLKTRRTGNIGVLLTEHLTYAFEDAASTDFLAGLAAATTDRSTSMLLLPVGPDTSVDAVAAQQLVHSHAMDGCVVYSVAADDPYLKAVITLPRPLVICDQPADVHDAGFVGIDDYAAIAPTAHAIAKAGHTSIGILTIRLDRRHNNGIVSDRRLAHAGHHVQRSRVQGALEVFAGYGIPRGNITIIERHINDEAHCRDAARELLDTHPGMTACLCTVDSMALAMREVAAERTISIPDQLSLTGFDGIQRALACELTTVIQPNKDKGRATGELLLSMIDESLNRETQPRRAKKNDAPQPRVLLPTTFFAGSTVAAPRSR